MAHTKGQGSTRNGRDSASKRLGIKCHDGQTVPAGSIIVRQRGTPVKAGWFVGVGKDWTLYAKVSGTVRYTKTNVVSILPHSAAPAARVAASAASAAS